MDVQSLIDQAGSVVELATRLRVARTTVLDWKRTGAIPGNRVSQIAHEFSIPAEQLLSMVQPAKSARVA